MQSYLSELIDFVPPPEEPYSDWDWEAIESYVGRTLPDDYKQFFDIYGYGCVGEFLLLAPKLEQSLTGSDTVGRYFDLFTSGELILLEDYEDIDNLFGESSCNFLAWATVNGVIYGWDTRKEDPNEWPVASVDVGEYTPTECGFTEFLYKFYSGQLIHPLLFTYTPPELDLDPPTELPIPGIIVHELQEDLSFHPLEVR